MGKRAAAKKSREIGRAVQPPTPRRPADAETSSPAGAKIVSAFQEAVDALRGRKSRQET